MARSSSPRSPRGGASRADRVAQVVRETVATELERLGDEALEMVTVTDVVVEGDLSVAHVYYSAITATEDGRLDEVVEALDEVRWPIQKKVNRVVRARRTPRISFEMDEVLNSALHLDDLIAGRIPPAGDTGD